MIYIHVEDHAAEDHASDTVSSNRVLTLNKILAERLFDSLSNDTIMTW